MNQKILSLAIPNIITNLSVPLLGLVDTALMGHLESEAYLGAIGLGSMIFNFVFWAFGFLRMGTTGFTAQAYGNKDFVESFYTLIRALTVAILGAVILISTQYFIAELSFYLIRGSQKVEDLAQSYFYIRIYAAPTTISIYALSGWFLGMQNAKIPMLIASTVNLANIAFNLFFIKVLHMTSDGVALGTVIAQYLGLLVGVFMYLKHYRNFKQYWNFSIIFQKTALLKFFNVNQDIFIRTMALLFTFSFFQAESARFGNTILAVNTVLLQFTTLLAFGIDGLAFATEALVGKYVGAKDTKSLSKVIKLVFIWAMLLAGVFSLSYFLFFNTIIQLLTNNSTVIQATQAFLVWIVLAPLVNTPCFIWDGVYIGATASKAMRNNMLLATFFCFLPTYYFTANALENHALWLALSIFMMVRGLGLTFLAKKVVFRSL